jgi:hypothetical protein
MISSKASLADVWAYGGLSPQALAYADMPGVDPVLPSSFAVGAAAQVSIAAAALAACELGQVRGQQRQAVAVDMTHAALECVGWFSINGQVLDLWDSFSGLYACADGWVRIHANFAHHRDGALALLGLSSGTAQRDDAQRALRNWKTLDFEAAAAERGLVVAALRSFAQWDAHPQAQALAQQPLLTLERIGDAPVRSLPPFARGPTAADGFARSGIDPNCGRAGGRAHAGGVGSGCHAGQRAALTEYRFDRRDEPWQAVLSS